MQALQAKGRPSHEMRSGATGCSTVPQKGTERHQQARSKVRAELGGQRRAPGAGGAPGGGHCADPRNPGGTPKVCMSMAFLPFRIPTPTEENPRAPSSFRGIAPVQHVGVLGPVRPGPVSSPRRAHGVHWAYMGGRCRAGAGRRRGRRRRRRSSRKGNTTASKDTPCTEQQIAESTYEMRRNVETSKVCGADGQSLKAC